MFTIWYLFSKRGISKTHDKHSWWPWWVISVLSTMFSYLAKIRQNTMLICVQFYSTYVTLNEICKFSKLRIKFAGHSLSAAGIGPDPNRLSAVINMVLPSNISEVRYFLDIVNQVAKFFHTCRTVCTFTRPVQGPHMGLGLLAANCF